MSTLELKSQAMQPGGRCNGTPPPPLQKARMRAHTAPVRAAEKKAYCRRGSQKGGGKLSGEVRVRLPGPKWLQRWDAAKVDVHPVEPL